MATTQIADVLVGRPFTDYVQLLSTTLSALWQSGLVVTDPAMTAKLAGAGRLFDINHWNDLGDNEANTSSDNPASSATPLKVGSTLVTAMRVKRNQHWGIMDLVPS
ncbi:MAG: major capsid protein, partial [Candidatus Thorarchaeota archaeon]